MKRVVTEDRDLIVRRSLELVGLRHDGRTAPGCLHHGFNASRTLVCYAETGCQHCRNHFKEEPPPKTPTA